MFRKNLAGSKSSMSTVKQKSQQVKIYKHSQQAAK
jgi:hypothetical protein